MPKRYQNKKHLEWVRSLDCCIGTHYKRLEMMGVAPSDYLGLSPTLLCSDGIEAHHLLKPFYSERGMALKAGDKDVIPLCNKHHRELHMKGDEYKFFQEVTANSRFGLLSVQQVWMASPFYKKGI